MAMRSWLFVPGDSQPKLDKVASLGADVVIVDLEDAVAPPAKPAARLLANSWLETHGRQILAGGGFGRWVRINPLDTPLWREDLAAIMPGRPDGIMVPKAAGPEQLQVLAAELIQPRPARVAHSTPMRAAWRRSTRAMPTFGISKASRVSPPIPMPTALPACSRFTRARCP